ncbi:MAG: MFS transporter [Candidatus Muproteobacteria bacterium RBG_16_65_31]|uniref:MFS transporter n=1 Tax=Candidatus Muproteobacteria bacterium RBG_16_65_31 TaxID=1817759 RepID=A0A1F6TJ59_9PROT|nr:MAG: MFS transporter [Candidatus Muproteobacteria bacterium RBG_16_65_31]
MPYWRLSGFYFFYFATLGALVPYWGLYLQSVGFTARDIGNLMALLMIARIVAPNVWAWFADHRQNRMRVVRYSAFLTPVTFAGVLLGADFWWLALVMLLFSFFWHASLPLLEVLVMQHTGARPGAYGRVRLWGSLGFIAAVLALGPVIDARGPRLVPLVLLVLMLGIWLFSLTLPESEARGRVEHPTSFIRLILRPEIFAFLLACFLMQVSHGPYYTFYTIYLEGHGYSKALIGLLWALAVLCEIGVFLAMARILRHIGLREVLLASFLFAAARWLLIGFFPASLAVLVAAQTLHAVTFGAFHAAGMQLVYRFFTGHHQHRGQSVYSTAGFGAGGAVGSFYSGYFWDTLGPLVTYGVAAAAAAAAFVVAAFMFRSGPSGAGHGGARNPAG